MSRNYDDPVYKKFRKSVRNRDKKCRWPNCKKRRGLQVHHIFTWKHYPHLRYEISNGITLCKQHHKAIKGQESNYIKLFIDIIKNGT